MKRTERESAEDGDVDVDVDVDQDFLDRILNTLYDFGDGSDGTQSKRKHKKRRRLKQEDDENVTAQGQNLHNLDCEKDDQANASHVTDSVRNEKISASTSGDSESSERKASAVEIVTFQDPLKKNKLKRAAEPETRPDVVKEKKKKEPDFLSMEKARLDVHRFGITGFQKQQQRVFEQDRAIMLGAKPPKKDYVNYKVYQQTIKERKSKEKEAEAKPDPQKKKKKSSVKQKTVKRKPGSSSAEPSGHVGRFKNGMLVLSSKVIQKLNSKVRK